MRTRQAVCKRKLRHASREAAMIAVAAAAAAGLVLRPYRCDRCGQFHLTSRTRGKWLPLQPRADAS